MRFEEDLTLTDPSTDEELDVRVCYHYDPPVPARHPLDPPEDPQVSVEWIEERTTGRVIEFEELPRKVQERLEEQLLDIGFERWQDYKYGERE